MEEMMMEDSNDNARHDWLLSLKHMRKMDELRDWWRDKITSIATHDLSVVGEAEDTGESLKVRSIVFAEGEVRGSTASMLDRCSRLITTWSLMEEPLEIDLGSCSCVGNLSSLRPVNDRRRFFVHGHRLGNSIIFVLISTRGKVDVNHAKRFLKSVVQPIAKFVANTDHRHLTADNSIECLQCNGFTTRELEIVTALGRGMTNKEIARHLGTSPNTVRNQIARMAQKTGARSRAQLALMAPA